MGKFIRGPYSETYWWPIYQQALCAYLALGGEGHAGHFAGGYWLRAETRRTLEHVFDAFCLIDWHDQHGYVQEPASMKCAALIRGAAYRYYSSRRDFDARMLFSNHKTTEKLSVGVYRSIFNHLGAPENAYLVPADTDGWMFRSILRAAFGMDIDRPSPLVSEFMRDRNQFHRQWLESFGYRPLSRNTVLKMKTH